MLLTLTGSRAALVLAATMSSRILLEPDDVAASGAVAEVVASSADASSPFTSATPFAAFRFAIVMARLRGEWGREEVG